MFKKILNTFVNLFKSIDNTEAVENIRKLIDEIGGDKDYGYLSRKQIKKIHAELDKIK